MIRKFTKTTQNPQYPESISLVITITYLPIICHSGSPVLSRAHKDWLPRISWVPYITSKTSRWWRHLDEELNVGATLAPAAHFMILYLVELLDRYRFSESVPRVSVADVIIRHYIVCMRIPERIWNGVVIMIVVCRQYAHVRKHMNASSVSLCLKNCFRFV